MWRLAPHLAAVANWHGCNAAAMLLDMSHAAEKLLREAMTLSEDQRLEVASQLIASVDGPPDSDWETAWLAELDRRSEAAVGRGEPADEWSEVRARILNRLG